VGEDVLFSSHLGKRSAVTLNRDECWVITEASVTRRFDGDPSLYSSIRYQLTPVRPPHHGNSAKAGGSPTLRHVSEFAKQSLQVGLVVATLAGSLICGVTGRMHARGAIEDIYLKSGVVGYSRSAHSLANSDSFQAGIGLKCETVLNDVPHRFWSWFKLN
tara:strand:+ start:1044 stop:1523 length:480 start_codon:yes stop_codon:yes gene_type:complete